MNNTLIIFGAGGHGKVVADVASAMQRWETIVFADDRYPAIHHNAVWEVTCTCAQALHDTSQCDVIVAIGDNNKRLAMTHTLLEAQASLATVIHPSAIVSPHASIGAGSVIFAGAIINIDACVGLACIINSNVVVEHDCIIHDGAHLSPGAQLAGNVKIGQSTWIGLGSNVREGITVGHHACVGAGAVVIKAVADNSTVVGVPAKAIKVE